MAKVWIDVPDAVLADWLRTSLDRGVTLEEMLAVALTELPPDSIRPDSKSDEQGEVHRPRPGPEEVAAAIDRGRGYPADDLPERGVDGSDVDHDDTSEQPSIVLSGLERTRIPKRIETVQVTEVDEEAMLPGSLLRSLPLKVALRAISTKMATGPLDDSAARGSVEHALSAVWRHLGEIDEKRGLLHSGGMAAAFGADGSRARGRLVNQLLGAAGRSGGLLEVLGFHVRTGSGHYLTDAGLSFSKRRNPVLDGDSETALTEREQLALLGFIHARLPAEWRSMQLVLEAVATSALTNTELDMILTEGWGPGTPAGWTTATVRTRRVGLIGRLAELGLVERRWQGRQVLIIATEAAGDRMGTASRSTD